MIMLSKDWLEWFFQAYANRNLLEYVTACSGFFFPHSIRQSYLRARFAGNSAAIACTPCCQDENGKEMWWACGTIAIAPIACHARSLRVSLLNNENLVLSKGLIINYHRERFGKLTFWAVNFASRTEFLGNFLSSSTSLLQTYSSHSKFNDICGWRMLTLSTSAFQTFTVVIRLLSTPLIKPNFPACFTLPPIYNTTVSLENRILLLNRASRSPIIDLNRITLMWNYVMKVLVFKSFAV